jgi:histidine triad (HIT) family protein
MMPRRIARDEAVARALAERGEARCLICALRDGAAGPRWTIAEGEHAIVLLSRYALRWGHALVAIRGHVENFSEVTDAAWAEASSLALRTARALERALSPRRVYVASLGAAAPDLPMSSPHLHLHVVPLHDPGDRPSAVFTLSEGTYDGTAEEWAELRERLSAALLRT